jgi:hypothetical protein
MRLAKNKIETFVIYQWILVMLLLLHRKQVIASLRKLS